MLQAVVPMRFGKGDGNMLGTTHFRLGLRKNMVIKVERQRERSIGHTFGLTIASP